MRMIIDLARALDLEVVAEGIESGGRARRAARPGLRARPGLLPVAAAVHLEHRGTGADRTAVQEPSRRSGIRTIDPARAAVRRANPPRGGDAKPGASRMEAAQPPARLRTRAESRHGGRSVNALRPEHRLPDALDDRPRPAGDGRRAPCRARRLARRAPRHGRCSGRDRAAAVAEPRARRRRRALAAASASRSSSSSTRARRAPPRRR